MGCQEIKNHLTAKKVRMTGRRRMLSTSLGCVLWIYCCSSSSSIVGTVMALSTHGTNRMNRNANGMIVKKQKPMPVVGYDAEKILHTYDRKPLEVGWRLNVLSLPLLGWYMGLLMDKSLGIDGNDEVKRKRGEELRLHLVRSGSVALIKSGQALSLRPDLLKNPIWAEELGKLVDAVGSFPDVVAMDILRSQLSDLLPRIRVGGSSVQKKLSKKQKGNTSKISRM